MPKKTPAPKPLVVPTGMPSALKWARGLAIFQIIVGALACAFFIWLFSVSDAGAFIQGMREGVMEEFNKAFSFTSSAEVLGALTALFTLALIGPILILVAISRRTKNWTIASLVFNGLLLVASFSLVTIAIVILMLLEPSRKYLNLN